MATALLKLTDVQLGSSVTATNNFTIYQPASPDGTVRIGNGNSGSATDIMTLNSSGNVGIGTSSPSDIITLSGGSSGSYGLTINNAKEGGGTKAYFQYDRDNGLAVVAGVTTNGLVFKTLTAGNTTEKMRLDSSGNLGLGVTPSAWDTTYKALEIGRIGNAFAGINGGTESTVVANAYYNGSWKYATSSLASRYMCDNTGKHFWYTAPSGTAGNAITFTQAMTLDASGNLMVGTTTIGSGNRMNVVGNNVTFSPNTAGKETFVFTTGAADKGVFYIKNDTTNTVKLDTNGDSYLNGGNVGIGTSSPGTALNVTRSSVTGTDSDMPFIRAVNSYASQGNGSTSFNQAGFNVNAGNGSVFGGLRASYDSAGPYGTGVQLFVNSTNPLQFYTNGSERMRIDSSGNLLVGTTNTAPNAGDGMKFASNRLSVVNNGGAEGFIYYNSSAGAYRFYVTANGVINATSTTITAISDQRLKENVRDLDFGLNEVLAIKPRRFDWKDGKGLNKKNDVGFIAQEFETVFPNSVTTSLAGEDGVEYKAVSQSELIPTLVKAIQEQQAIIESLTKRIETLEGAK